MKLSLGQKARLFHASYYSLVHPLSLAASLLLLFAILLVLGKVIRTALLEKHKWKQELNRFLLSCRTTPHSTTKIPPAQLLFKRVVKGKLFIIPANKYPVNRHNEAKINDAKSKEQSKQCPYMERRVKESKISVGDKCW